MSKQATWGSRAWFDLLFSQQESEPWGHDWRGTQSWRYRRLAALAQPALACDSPLVLDVGCAWGTFTTRLSRLNSGGRVFGVDIAYGAARTARRNLPAAHFAVAALPSLGFAAATFDLVVTAEIICYLSGSERAAALQEVARILRPGGYLLFSNVLDDGSRYFTNSGALELVDSALEVVRVEYEHNRLIRRVEDRLLHAHQQLARLSAILVDETVYRDWLNEHAGQQREQMVNRLRRRARWRLPRTLLLGALALARRIIRTGLRFEWPVALLQALAQRRFGKRARTAVFILAQKA